MCVIILKNLKIPTPQQTQFSIQRQTGPCCSGKKWAFVYRENHSAAVRGQNAEEFFIVKQVVHIASYHQCLKYLIRIKNASCIIDINNFKCNIFYFIIPIF
jgi:hypothetical protein